MVTKEFPLNKVFKENVKEYRSNPVMATKYKPGMENGWMIHISGKPLGSNEKYHTHEAVKFFPTREDAIAYVEANEKQYIKMDEKLVECEVEYDLLSPILYRERTEFDSDERVGMDFMYGKYHLESDEAEDYDYYILDENVWIVQDASGNIRVWEKDFLECGITLFGDIFKNVTICEKVDDNTYIEVAV